MAQDSVGSKNDEQTPDLVIFAWEKQFFGHLLFIIQREKY